MGNCRRGVCRIGCTMLGGQSLGCFQPLRALFLRRVRRCGNVCLKAKGGLGWVCHVIFIRCMLKSEDGSWAEARRESGPARQTNERWEAKERTDGWTGTLTQQIGGNRAMIIYCSTSSTQAVSSPIPTQPSFHSCPKDSAVGFAAAANQSHYASSALTCNPATKPAVKATT